MDAYDIWHKLIVGTSFDPSKRKKRKKPKNRKRKKPEESGENETVNHDSESETNDEIPSPVKQELTNESNDISLLTSSGRSPKKQKKAPLSLMKLSKMKNEEIAHFRRTNQIHVEGSDIPGPIQDFQQLKTDYGLNDIVLSNITDSGYTKPTPIQMQAIPLLMSGRQMLACAPTGSGKTASFLIPILHNLKGPQNKGFRALILAPTRELVKQIYQDCLRLAKGINLRPHVIDKVKADAKKQKLYTKYDILVATPNRLIYMLRQDPPLISLERVEWFIVDESDKLFEEGEKGFRTQLAEVYRACDTAQVKRAMFSATYSHEVEKWCKMNIDSVVAVSIGERNTAVETIKQELRFVGWEAGKMVEFRKIVQKGLIIPMLIFVQSKERARDLYKELVYSDYRIDVIHSDLTQLQRDTVIQNFRSGKIWILICTELMGRGIDFKGVSLVLNYDFPPTAISYIHRIGRTGRAGKPGQAITFFTEDDVENLRSIAQVIKNAGCEVPEFIMQLKKKPKKKGVVLPIKRRKISTVPKYVIAEQTKLKNLISGSKRRKQKLQKTANPS